MNHVSRRNRIVISVMCAIVATSGLFAAVGTTQALDPGAFFARAFLGALKKATADRAAGIGVVNSNRNQALQELDERQAVADYYASKGWISPEEHATVSQQITQLSGGVEDLARRERNIVRKDTDFLRNLGQNIVNGFKGSAPQILAENLGLPPFAARTLGNILNGQKPLSAALDSALTKLSGGPLVDPSKGPLDDLRAQIDALHDATDALRGTSRIRIAAELLGVKDELDRIALLPTDQQGAELGTIRGVLEAAEGVLQEAGRVRDTWLPRYAGPNEQRFARDAERQAILEELKAAGEPDLSAAVLAGAAAQGRRTVEQLVDELGVDPTSVDIDALVSAITRQRAEALARGERPSTEELVRTALGDAIPGGGGGGPAPTQPRPTQPRPTQPAATQPVATQAGASPTTAAVATPTVPRTTTATVPGATATATQPAPTNTASPTDTPTPTPTPTPSPTPTTPAITNFAGSWHSTGECGNPDAPFRWTVSLTQSGASVTGTITFHACPDGGRVNYSVTGTATSAPTITLQGTTQGGAGPLGGSAPSSQTFTLTKNGTPSPNLAG